jgi:hypothetical protein
MKPEIRWFRNGAEWDTKPDDLDGMLKEAKKRLEERHPKK